VDDSLDVVAAHGFGGITGALLTGVFARAVWGGVDGKIFVLPVERVVRIRTGEVDTAAVTPERE